MTTVHQLLNTALTPVLANTWAVELPPKPTYPAAVYDVDSQTEERWDVSGGYMQHDVNLVVLARTIEELDVLLPMDGGGSLRSALEAMPSFQFEDDSGDADYEPDPAVYARYLTVRLRTPRF